MWRRGSILWRKIFPFFNASELTTYCEGGICGSSETGSDSAGGADLTGRGTRRDPWPPECGQVQFLNRLLREERAIVTAIPGTTRDVIEESIDLDGVTIRLVDTAGVRETDDIVEQEGIKRTRAAQDEADLLLVVVDRSVPLTNDDRELLSAVKDRKHVVLLNKADLADEAGVGCRACGPLFIQYFSKNGCGG